MFKLSRRQAINTLLAATPIAAAIDAFLIEPDLLSITRREITLPKLPAELDGFTIAQLSDLHYKPEKDHELMSKAVAAVNAENVDFIALTGDYVTDDVGVISPLIEHLKQLQSKHGIVATMGNHDGWTHSNGYFRKIFSKAGIPFLINQNTELNINGTTLHIAGTDYVWLGSPDPTATLKGIPTDSPVIVLVHEPDYFDTMRSVRDIDLQLSGHTHGGQCRVPFIGYAPVKVKHGENYVYGYYKKGNSQLFVSRGLGTSGMRVRFACKPELAILTLRSSPRT
ncbi:MAG: metallophosphoesterase [Rubritalea sp.]|uniref:metallophosphoesterase n=1 Tax=Rubritalea sp. TaxID=2109375 RepID=UPI003242CB02